MPLPRLNSNIYYGSFHNLGFASVGARRLFDFSFRANARWTRGLSPVVALHDDLLAV